MKFFRKTLAVCLMLTVLSFSFAAFAEESTETSPLPCGVRFGMSLDELSALLGENALIETWDEDAGTGSASMENVDTGIGDLTADYITFQADRNNSAGKSRLSMISMSLPVLRTTRSAEPALHMDATMHEMHSEVPGTGARRHRLQSMIKASPMISAEGGSSPSMRIRISNGSMDACRRERT